MCDQRFKSKVVEPQAAVASTEVKEEGDGEVDSK